jgi:putative hydrolase of the HAD superfamily
MASLSLPPRGALDAVLLDAGGVLVDPDWHRVAALMRRHGIEVSAEALIAAEPLAKRRLDRREQIEATDDERRAFIYYDFVLSGAGHSEPVPLEVWAAVRAEHARSNFWRVVPPGVPEALRRLREAGLRLALVSNANGTVHALMEDVGLAGYFDTLLDSRVEGVEKPDPEIFRRALQRVGAEAGRSLHVGDLYHVDVVGARSAGAHAALIDVAGLYPEADCPRFPSLAELTRSLLG